VTLSRKPCKIRESARVSRRKCNDPLTNLLLAISAEKECEHPMRRANFHCWAVTTIHLMEKTLPPAYLFKKVARLDYGLLNCALTSNPWLQQVVPASLTKHLSLPYLLQLFLQQSSMTFVMFVGLDWKYPSPPDGSRCWILATTITLSRVTFLTWGGRAVPGLLKYAPTFKKLHKNLVDVSLRIPTRRNH
jgi:hypothetical protein